MLGVCVHTVGMHDMGMHDMDVCCVTSVVFASTVCVCMVRARLPQAFRKYDFYDISSALKIIELDAH